MEDNREENDIYITDKIVDVINDNLDELGQTEKGSDAYAAIVKDTKILGDLYVDIKKVECEYNDHEAQREHEVKMKREEAKHANKLRIFEIIVPAITTIGVAAYRIGTATKMYRTTLKCEYCDDKAILNRNFQGLFNSTWRP